MKNLTKLYFFSEKGRILTENNLLKFLVSKSGTEPATARFTAELDFELLDEIVFEYSLLGLYRGMAYRTPLLYLLREDGETVSLIANDDCNTDGRKYTVCASVPKGKYTSLTIEISVDRAKTCELCVYSLYTCTSAISAGLCSAFCPAVF